MEYKEFDKDFVKRTLEILENCDTEYEVTLLINCLAGLLILPKEKYFQKIPDTHISELQDWGIEQKHITRVRCDCCGYNLKNIVRQLRNSVAHMHIKAYPQSEHGEPKKVIEKIEFNDHAFCTEIPVDNLRTFAVKLANYVTSSSQT